MTIKEQSVVSIDYTLTNDQGEVIDSSEGNDPLAYLHGSSNIIPGLESALTGKKVGDNFKVTVQPADGYGEVNSELTQVVPSSAFEGVENIEPGMQFHAQGPEGETEMITVTAVDGDEVTISGNHPLAGEVLHFDVTVKEVREATEEELAHGHVHTTGDNPDHAE
ncbi:MAG: peptidylprolyl isomerase [Gammaproteobacteria bacterium]|nr:peptidylprolyl isomerase [Gammaproteobacteria bacterium]